MQREQDGSPCWDPGRGICFSGRCYAIRSNAQEFNNQQDFNEMQQVLRRFRRHSHSRTLRKFKRQIFESLRSKIEHEKERLLGSFEDSSSEESSSSSSRNKKKREKHSSRASHKKRNKHGDLRRRIIDSRERLERRRERLREYLAEKREERHRRREELAEKVTTAAATVATFLKERLQNATDRVKDTLRLDEHKEDKRELEKSGKVGTLGSFNGGTRGPTPGIYSKPKVDKISGSSFLSPNGETPRRASTKVDRHPVRGYREREVGRRTFEAKTGNGTHGAAGNAFGVREAGVSRGNPLVVKPPVVTSERGKLREAAEINRPGAKPAVISKTDHKFNASSIPETENIPKKTIRKPLEGISEMKRKEESENVLVVPKTPALGPVTRARAPKKTNETIRTPRPAVPDAKSELTTLPPNKPRGGSTNLTIPKITEKPVPKIAPPAVPQAETGLPAHPPNRPQSVLTPLTPIIPEKPVVEITPPVVREAKTELPALPPSKPQGAPTPMTRPKISEKPVPEIAPPAVPEDKTELPALAPSRRASAPTAVSLPNIPEEPVPEKAPPSVPEAKTELPALAPSRPPSAPTAITPPKIAEKPVPEIAPPAVPEDKTVLPALAPSMPPSAPTPMTPPKIAENTVPEIAPPAVPEDKTVLPALAPSIPPSSLTPMTPPKIAEKPAPEIPPPAVTEDKAELPALAPSIPPSVPTPMTPPRILGKPEAETASPAVPEAFASNKKQSARTPLTMPMITEKPLPESSLGAGLRSNATPTPTAKPESVRNAPLARPGTTPTFSKPDVRKPASFSFEKTPTKNAPSNIRRENIPSRIRIGHPGLGRSEEQRMWRGYVQPGFRGSSSFRPATRLSGTLPWQGWPSISQEFPQAIGARASNQPRKITNKYNRIFSTSRNLGRGEGRSTWLAMIPFSTFLLRLKKFEVLQKVPVWYPLTSEYLLCKGIHWQPNYFLTLPFKNALQTSQSSGRTPAMNPSLLKRNDFRRLFSSAMLTARLISRNQKPPFVHPPVSKGQGLWSHWQRQHPVNGQHLHIYHGKAVVPRGAYLRAAKPKGETSVFRVWPWHRIYARQVLNKFTKAESYPRAPSVLSTIRNKIAYPSLLA
ncbi:uncharacterized protein LOC144121695 isoform X1 [Amblyomma americanum]